MRGARGCFFEKIDMSEVAAMGMSCGGLMTYGASGDKHITTIGIWNSCSNRTPPSCSSVSIAAYARTQTGRFNSGV